TGHCYNPVDGTLGSCFSASNRGTFIQPIPGIEPASSPAALANAQWIVTESGPLGRVNNVSPFTTAASINDNWSPSSKLNLTLGLRFENYTNRLGDTSASPIGNSTINRAFWIKAFNNENCYKPGVFGV